MLQLNNSEGDILEGSMEYYSKLFRNMVFDGDFSHGFTWSIGGKNRARQISIDNYVEKKMSPSDLGIIAIAVSLSFGSENTPEQRFAHQYSLLRLGIINHDDIEDHAGHFSRVTRAEHVTQAYMHHIVEDAGKITVLRRAYEQLNSEKKWGNLTNSEDKILLGYIISMLGGTYAIRPYMIDEEMSHQESWVEYYDQLFDDFSQKSFEYYNKEGFGRIWIDFMELRNDIAMKKGIPKRHIRIPYQIVGDGVKALATEIIKRAM